MAYMKSLYETLPYVLPDKMTAVSRGVRERYRLIPGGISPGLPSYDPSTFLTHRPGFPVRTALSVNNSIAVSISMRITNNMKRPSYFPKGDGYFGIMGSSNPEYELYIQKSMIRDVYSMYRSFTERIREKHLLREERGIVWAERLGGEMLRRFTDFVARRTVYDNPPPYELRYKPGMPAVNPPHQTEREVTVQPVRRVIEVTEENTGSTPMMNGVRGADFDRVMERVYRKLEDKLRYERIRKGF